MKLRSGKILSELFPKENQPFRLINLKEKSWIRSEGEIERKEPNIRICEAWVNWVHTTKKFRKWILFENVESDQRKEEMGLYEVNIDFGGASEEWSKTG